MVILSFKLITTTSGEPQRLIVSFRHLTYIYEFDIYDFHDADDFNHYYHSDYSKDSNS